MECSEGACGRQKFLPVSVQTCMLIGFLYDITIADSILWHPNFCEQFLQVFPEIKMSAGAVVRLR